MYHFLRSFPFTKPRFVPVVITDWIVGLSMRDYVNRNLAGRLDELRSEARRRIKRTEKLFQNYVRRGALEVTLLEAKDAVTSLSISMKGRLDRRFFKRAARHLAKVLDHSSARVTLRIEELHHTQHRNLQLLLRRLTRYGDRVSVAIRDEMTSIIEVDSSVFNLVLE
jgi:hypothetical protein